MSALLRSTCFQDFLSRNMHKYFILYSRYDLHGDLVNFPSPTSVDAWLGVSRFTHIVSTVCKAVLAILVYEDRIGNGELVCSLCSTLQVGARLSASSIALQKTA